MIVHFCPQCGQKAEPLFIFCPYCGIKLPRDEQEVILQGTSTSLTSDSKKEVAQRKSPTKRKFCLNSPQKEIYDTPTKLESPDQDCCPVIHVTSKAKNSPRAKRAKTISVDPLPESTIVTDNSSKKWKVEAPSPRYPRVHHEAQLASGTSVEKQKYSLKLDAKDGRIYNEQNFFQRAAKKTTVDKWKKSHDVPFLGIPNCVGFGLHEDIYRFLVFVDLGRSLQSILDEGVGRLSEKTVFQISCRMLDVLEYIHENEYVHGDIKAENIFVNPANLQEVYLVGYYSSFRYAPGGKHGAYREGSRSPHEGTVEFISVDLHKGAAPSRRSDLETLGYCMLKWLHGSLPWNEEINVTAVMNHKERYKADITELLRQCYGRKKSPGVLKDFLEQVMFLNYDEKPDYEGLKKILAQSPDNIQSFVYSPLDLKVLLRV
ncbi:LOW QUALITY PROTEIN: serine/threonine-protein kinase VRK3 [Microcaecilia unicolor]|uniref:non-specific serine/threonine protein kinase n=1 Tax=Microcaecilia unicolor TaxID=1415580 RepID=A0A6P7Y3S0_9AMPH|nr:LOW QUALITY PROTEIN: inactive serine/threonine-protein kinase VRK3 [Microcaecilia unicolor]